MNARIISSQKNSRPEAARAMGYHSIDATIAVTLSHASQRSTWRVENSGFPSMSEAWGEKTIRGRLRGSRSI